MKQLFKKLPAAALALGLTVSFGASAADTYKVKFTDGSSGYETADDSGVFNTKKLGESGFSGKTVGLSAYSQSKVSGSTIVGASYEPYGGSGTGVSHTGESGSPEHAVDNNNNVDSVLLDFGEDVTVSSVKFGWYSGDSDFTLLQYTGAGAPTLLGNSYSDLSGNGWQLVGNYFNPAQAPQLLIILQQVLIICYQL